MHDWLSTLGFAMGAAWTSGIRLYATVATLGLLQHFGYTRLPGDLGHLGQWWVIGVAGVMCAIEFLADKVPAVDSAWDAVHTFIRIPAGAVLAASAFADFSPSVRILAFLAGGSVALASHGTNATTRLAINASPEPFSNIFTSLLEDLFAAAALVLLVWKPVVILAGVLIFLATVAWMAPKMLRALRRLYRSRFARPTSTQVRP